MTRSLILAFTTAALISGLPVATAQAKGCVKGAIVGGIAGHVAGHGIAGAAAGCAIGHHRAAKKERQQGSEPQAR